MKDLKIPKPNWIPQDKWDHFVIGFPLGMLAFVGSHILFEKLFLSILISIFIGALIGFIKEVSDKLNRNKKLFDVLDIVAGATGSFLGAMFCLIIYSLLG